MLTLSAYFEGQSGRHDNLPFKSTVNGYLVWDRWCPQKGPFPPFIQRVPFSPLFNPFFSIASFKDSNNSPEIEKRKWEKRLLFFFFFHLRPNGAIFLSKPKRETHYQHPPNQGQNGHFKGTSFEKKRKTLTHFLPFMICIMRSGWLRTVLFYDPAKASKRNSNQMVVSPCLSRLENKVQWLALIQSIL